MIKITLKEKSVIALMKSSETNSNYFFGKYEKLRLFLQLKHEGFFLPQHNPSPKKIKNGYQIPEWNVLPYLETISKKTRKYDKELLEIIKSVSLYKDQNGNHIDNYRTWWFFVKILLNIPLKKIPLDIFTNAMPIWLTSMFDLTLPGSDLAKKLLPLYLEQAERQEDIKKVEELINILLSIKDPQEKEGVLGKTIDIETKIDEYWLEEGFLKQQNISLIAKKCSNEPILHLANTIKEIFIKKKLKQEDYSIIWLKNLSKEYEMKSYHAEYALAVILQRLVLEKAKNNKDGEEIIKRFLSDAYPQYLFKRLSIIMIANFWDSYQKYFNQILIDNKQNYFDIDSFYPELSYFLKKNSEKLSQVQKNILEEIIKKGAGQDLPSTNKSEYQNFWKQRWYKVLSTIPQFKNLYDELKQVTKKEIFEEEPEEESGVWLNLNKSPLSAEEFLEKKNEDIVRYINNYQPKRDIFDISPEGIQRTLQSAVKANPAKFTQNLAPFKKANYYTLSSLCDGLKEAWISKKNIDWENFIKFISEKLQEKNFWEKGEKDKNSFHNYFNWFLSSIGYLIQEGCKSDEWAFDESLHEDVESIITTLVDRLPLFDNAHRGDGVTRALNSTWGKILTALIYLGLREARLSDKRGEKKESKWSKSLKENFEKVLKRNVYDAYTLLGQYLPNLHYIDKKWTENYAKKMALTKNQKQFKAFMEGYLFGGRVYDFLYKILNDSYARALKIELEEARIQGRLVHHIAVGYLRGHEEIIPNSLIYQLISSKKYKYIRELITFFWYERKFILESNKSEDKKAQEEGAKFRKRIFNFWDYMIVFYKNKNLTEDDKKVINELSKFAVFLSEIDNESFKKLLFSAPFVTYDHDSSFFIEYLNQLKDKGNPEKSAEYVGKLFIAMIKGATERLPDYNWGHIEEIVKYLYDQNNEKLKELASQICVIYAENGNYLLKEIYEENKLKKIVEAG